MKTTILSVLALSLLTTPLSYAQPGGAGGGMAGPRLDSATQKLFGEHKNFSAAMQMTAQGDSQGEAVVLPGQLAFSEGKSRFEMDLQNMKGGGMNAQAAAQMKSMGMDKMVTISRPDQKMSYVIYPGLKAYVAQPLTDGEGTASTSPEPKVKVTEMGKETVEGHPTVKNRVTITDEKGKSTEALVWNATDLKNFPVKMQLAEADTKVTLVYKDVKLTKPDASQFEAPSGFTKYSSMPEMMQAVMMKRFGGNMPPGAGAPQRPSR